LLVRPAIAEFIGAFTLTLAGVSSIVLTQARLAGSGLTPQGGDLVAIALAHGLAIGLMIAAMGHISGGHYNPAVSLAMLVTQRIGPIRFVVYVVAQLLGAVVAALIVKAIFPAALRDAVELGVPAVNGAITVGQAFVIEVIATFFLVLVIFGTAVDKRGAAVIAPLAIGLTITMDVFWAGGATGAAMNPSRAFGPALVQGFWDDHWIYWVAPAIGACIAGILHWFILQEGREHPAP
jgi:aquaporin Z